MVCNELRLTIPSPLHKQVGCYYPCTKKEILLYFRKKGLAVIAVQLEESMIEFKTVSEHLGKLVVLMSR